MSNLTRSMVLDLLDKCGAKYTKKITVERAVQKLTRSLEQNGVPEDLTEEEQSTLVGLGLVKAEKEAPKPKPAPKKTAAKKTKPVPEIVDEDPLGVEEEPKADPEEEKKAASKVKKEPKERGLDWMTCATRAVMSSSTFEEARAKTLSIYQNEGRKKTIPQSADKYALMYTGYAITVLTEVGVLKSEGGNITIL